MRFMAAIIALLFGLGFNAHAQPSAFVVHTTDTPFDLVKENLKLAITNRGLLVSGALHISDMLNRTAEDLGYSEVFSQAESIEFCSADMSHRMVQLHPDNMAICPFTIALYITKDKPNEVRVVYRRPELVGADPEQVSQFQDKLYSFFDEIVTEALAW